MPFSDIATFRAAFYYFPVKVEVEWIHNRLNVIQLYSRFWPGLTTLTEILLVLQMCNT